MSAAAHHDVIVIGAGIVGVCCALELQRQGHRVTVLDPRLPGTATSFGNAGIIASASITPQSVPGLWKRVPAMLFDPLSPLMLRWPHLLRITPWLIRFLAAGRRRRVERIASELAPLAAESERAHRRLIAANDVGAELLRAGGRLYVFGDAHTMSHKAFERELLARHGIRADVLAAEDVYALEPGLAPGVRCGLLYADESFVTEPVALTRAYADAFVARGGRFVHERVCRFELDDDGPRRVVTDLGIHDVDRLVLAAGAWSRELAAALGADVPLDTERGYHVSLPWNDRVTLNRPVAVAEHNYYLCPMREGVRITSGAELGGLKLPPDFRRIRRITEDARTRLTGLSGPVQREWMGYRPSLPDSKPVIARAPGSRRVFFAFGHGHLGLTLSAITGELVAALLADRAPAVAVEPFRSDRF